jgi:hypothetical protein
MTDDDVRTELAVEHANSYRADSHGGALYCKSLGGAGYPAQKSVGWPTFADDDADLGVKIAQWATEVHYAGDNFGERDFVLTVDDALVHLWVSGGNASLRVGAPTLARAEEIHQRVLEIVPRAEAADGTIPVTFWTLGPNGPVRRQRAIAVRPWDDVARNYAAGVRGDLEHLVREFTPSAGGQLLLWHGEPGTGKTHAIRALGWEWRDWCDVHYITDPEEFFGKHALYMLDVLLGEAENDRWRVLILEDSGELLAADAKLQTGQGLSRLLNTVDGMIGQGLRVLVLITTNDELKKLHPAVSRPGRCAAITEFVPLSWEEATEWLGEPVSSAMTIAELFAHAEGWIREDQDSRPTVGFGRATTR